MINGEPEDELERVALEMWRDREKRFPKFTRRMTPDAMDFESGAWALMLDKARESIARRQP